MCASNSSEVPSPPRPRDANTFPPNLSQVVLVCLVAVLIDYPVAYVPASPQQSHFLGGEPLDVYQVTITLSEPASAAPSPHFHIFLKFSCPAVLSAQYEQLKPASMVSNLKDRFKHRLENVGAEMQIQQSMETLDRVAL
ncbi:hypothetical protein CONPUDRAFT_55713 [Coniophora puteana RWD-64-598 SS2]|uniref:Uncharacterized protein n=1 Tax=Coniophora puteana (strain RWD-64-598) TaxID=741705 RepID=A0A5M3MPG0_CONPW|nr:uncharacterized protein CONPUDRAFT_55713 [Coniophora puteana RWD-64-598 SS2]EIW81069.1 hypothetical protein CONPUDRAFT_55713 [Coniophora puteana RWD-64-598 SS2]